MCLVLMDANGAVLATQRPAEKHMGLCWEFPGGKVETDESPEAALRREIQEELGISLGDLSPLPPVDHTYDFGSIRLLPYRSVCNPRPTLHLTEHAHACRIDPKAWTTLNWASADVPVIRHILESKGN